MSVTPSQLSGLMCPLQSEISGTDTKAAHAGPRPCALWCSPDPLGPTAGTARGAPSAQHRMGAWS